MPVSICRSKGYQTTLDLRVRGLLDVYDVLPGGLLLPRHGLPDYVILSSVALAVDDDEITLNLVSPPAGVTQILLQAGTVLEFPGTLTTSPPILVTLLQDSTIVVAPTAFPIQPIGAALAANAQTTDKALRFISGCYQATVTPQFKAEDTTDYESGTGTEQSILNSAKQVALEVNLLLNDPMHRDLELLCYDTTYMGLHMYLEITYNDGKRHRGYALINSATPQAAVQSLQKLQLQVNYQGGCYDFRGSRVLA